MTAHARPTPLELANGAELARTAQRLADVLVRENAALAAIDLLAAARFCEEKRSAADAFIRACAAPDARRTAARPGVSELGAHLGELAETNRRLLEQAIVVQRRVIRTFARAAPRSGASPRYGSTGALSTARVTPVALVARA